jgi:hypothetical protein
MRCITRMSREFARHAVAAIVLLSPLLFASAPASADPRAKQPDTSAVDVNGAPLSPEAEAALRDALVFDPTRWMDLKPATPRTAAQKAATQDLDWNRTDKPDGSAAVTVKKPLPIEWDAKVGADFGIAPSYGTNYQPDKTVPLGKEQNTGSTWASVTVPGVASIAARIDPNKDQSKVGTTVSRSVPFGTDYSLTLQNSFALTETLGSPSGVPTAAGTTPPGQPGPSQVWSNDRLVKFNFLSTGTSLGAGTMSSTAPGYYARNKIMAEQKLFDSLNITTAVTDVGAPTVSKSITAGFKWKW